MSVLSIDTLLSLLVLTGARTEENSASLPMGARTKTPQVPVYLSPETREHYAVIPEEGEYVGAWESQTSWIRITPSGFTPEGWVEVSWIELDPSSSANPEAQYLKKLPRAYQDYTESNTVTACGVFLEDVYYAYESSTSKTSFLLTVIEQGSIQPIYRQRNGRYEIRDQYSPHSIWIVAESIEISPPFATEGEPCLRDVAERYTFTAPNLYRKGPSDKFPPVAPYKAGETVEVTERYAGGWLAAAYYDLGTVWFRAEDIVPTSASAKGGIVRLRTGPGHNYPVVTEIKTANPYLILYEKSGDWYRVTPDTFVTAAWVAAREVEPAPLQELVPDNTKYYLDQLATPEKGAGARPPVREKSSSRKPFFAGPLAEFPLPWIFTLIISSLFGVTALVRDAMKWLFAVPDKDIRDLVGSIFGVSTLLSLATLTISARPESIFFAWVALFIFVLPPILYLVYLLFGVVDYLRNPHPLKAEVQSVLRADGQFDPEAFTSALRRHLASAPTIGYKGRNLQKHLRNIVTLIRDHHTLLEAVLGYERLRAIMEAVKEHEQRKA